MKWASLGPHGPDPNGPPWALMGRALKGPLGPNGPRPNEPPRVLVGQSIMGQGGLMGWALMGHSGPSGRP